MLGQLPPDLEKAAATAPRAKKQLWAGALANLTGPDAASTTVYTKASGCTWAHVASCVAVRQASDRRLAQTSNKEGSALWGGGRVGANGRPVRVWRAACIALHACRAGADQHVPFYLPSCLPADRSLVLPARPLLPRQARGAGCRVAAAVQ